MTAPRRRVARRSAHAAPPADLAPGSEALAAAARAIAAVEHEGRSADQALAVFDSHPDRAAIRAIALGAVRWYLRLAPAVASLLSRPAAQLDPVLRALLVAGAHQVEQSRNPPQSTVHIAVDAARALGQAHAAGFVNAVLRRFVTQREALFARLDADTAARTAHPEWFVAALEREWPDHAASILEANNAHPPMTLRVDVSRASIEEYLAELGAAGIPARSLAWCPTAVVLERPAPVGRLPGFAQGVVSVQDAGAQLAAPLLDARPGMRVLDACAAPGGKTGHLLEHTRDLAELIAADDDPHRLDKVKENLARLGRQARCIVADLREPLPDARFDRILVDAPCSSTGVIRRHPDIKLLRRESDVAPLARAQAAILAACFAMLEPGGRLVYSTCSVLAAENDSIVERLLAGEPAARLADWPAGVERPPGAAATRFGVQLLPGAAAGTDGFYYACLEKAAGAAMRSRT
jgi:16S rRNA (cytosine967-C5)-methyltransferase